MNDPVRAPEPSVADPALAGRLSDALQDRYAIERELGRGGMATVYLARDLKLHRLIALKVLRAELGATLGTDRFHREIQIAARLSHPNILQIYDSGAAGGHLYYAMPYVEGESLRQRLDREGQLAVHDVIDIVRSVASALTYAHEQGIIHRDIKPENILLARSSGGRPAEPLVADFGIARALDVAGSERLTETGLALGTPAYMSPEQAAPGGRLDGRSDIYALGCVAYEMLAGAPPFTGATAQAILARHAVDPVPPLRTVRATVPVAMASAIERALAKVPADRFATAGEFARALENIPLARFRFPVLAILARWRTLAIASGVLLVVAGSFLTSALTRHAPPPAPTDPNLLAIAPFDVLDPSLEVWHEGLVDILSRDLDGAGPLHTVPQTVGIKRWHGRADRVSAETFGHRTGAGLVVFGSVRKTRDTVSLRATVLDVARQRAEPDLEVKGDTAAIGDLADSLGVRILRVLGSNRPIGAVRHVSIASRSLPALKAFLYGEQFYRRGLWDSALVYYDLAIAQDSTFAIAYRNMALALSWFPASSDAYRPEEEYKRRSVTLGRGLPPRDSLLIAADSFAIASEEATDPADLIRFKYRALSIVEEAVRRYPGDPEMWLELGEARFHDAPPLGGVPASALEAFDHAIALDPGFAPAYEHTVNLSIRLNRPDLARKYAAAYLRLDPTDVNARSLRLAALMLDPERSHAPETARMIDNASAQQLFGAGMMHLGWWADSGEAGVRLLRALTRRSGTGVDPWSDTLMYHQYLALELAYRGHLQEAYATDSRLLLDPSASPFSDFRDPFRALALLGVIPESVTSTTFGHALEPGQAWPMSPLGTARQLRGLPWWLARRDTASLAQFALRAGQETRTQSSARGKLRGRYLQAAATAYLALARADSVRALRLFQSIPDTLCLENDCFYEKLIEARLLTAQGQARQAGAVLDRWVWSGGGPLFVLGILERGRIAEGLGQRQKATDSYQFVIDVWRRADPQLQPFVVEARTALTQLKRE
jgi:serine/threonine-protein kinase